MNTDLSIKNFRVFGQEGATVRLRPLTILTGCNNSGKSSVVRALQLFSDYMQKVAGPTVDTDRGVVDFTAGSLDFSTSQTNVLSGFSGVLSRKSEDGLIEIGYTAHSPLLGEDLRVKFTFGGGEGGAVDNGYFKEMEVTRASDGERVFCTRKESRLRVHQPKGYFEGKVPPVYIDEFRDKANFRLLSESFFKFLRESTFWYSKYEDGRVEYSGCEYGNAKNPMELKTKDLEDIKGHKKWQVFFPMDELFSELEGKSKEEQASLILDKASALGNEDFVSSVERMVADFQSGEHGSIVDYYRAKQGELLGKEVWYAPGSFILGATDGLSLQREKEIDFEYVSCVLSVLSKSDLKESGHSRAIDDDLFKRFVEEVYSTVLKNKIPELSCFIGTSYASVKRLYLLAESDEFSQVLHRFIEGKRKFEEFVKDDLQTPFELDTWGGYRPGSFIDKYLAKLGIAHHLEIQYLKEWASAAVVRLYESEEDKEGMLLADKGYGVTQLVTLLFNIEVEIMGKKTSFDGEVNDGKTFKELWSFRPSTIAVEEPEVHLHPKYQSLLADMFADAYRHFDIHFIVETHSEYLVRKLQTLVGEGEVSSSDISVVYMYDPDPSRRPEGEPQVKHIEVRPDGRLSEGFGSGFFDEADSLSLKLLTIKHGN